MDEYIRREDMLNAVEKLDIIPSVDGMGIPTGAEDFRVQFLGTVLKVEPADVAPVVRCKNCKHHTYDEIFSCYWCEHEGMVREVKPDFYCGYGEE